MNQETNPMILVWLNLFRNKLVEDGSAKLLEEFDKTMELIKPKSHNQVSAGSTIFGLIFVIIAVGPWLFGIYKMFK